MEEGCDSIALEMDIAPWGGQEFWVPTSFGHISVTVCGDQDKPALVTYPDVGLNSFSCFEGLLSCPDASSVLFHNFCFFHIQPPGHEIGAPDLAPEQATLSVDDLADQVAEVLDYFRLDEVIGLGVSGGAYILSLFACKYTDRALGLILVSPLARSPSWTEWLHNQALMNLLYFCGMTGFVKEMLLQRYFSLEVRDAAASVGESEVLTTIRQSMDERRSRNVMHYLQAIHQRRDLTENLKKLKCRTLILVGDQSPFHRDALHVSDAMNRRYNALIEVEGGGSLITEERPQAMLVPIELFLTGYAFYQRPVVSLSSSPKSPLSPLCMAAELLSPESLGLKLKPIKTRVASQRSMEVVDVVQKCVNLMESIYWSQLQTRAYRTHCHDITLVVCKLWPTLVEALQRRNPNLCEVPGAEEVFDALKAELENALAVVNKCCAMRQFDKLIDQGQTKRFLTMSRENLFMRSKEAYQYTMRVCPPKFRKKSPDPLQGRPESTPSSIASGEKSFSTVPQSAK